MTKETKVLKAFQTMIEVDKAKKATQEAKEGSQNAFYKAILEVAGIENFFQSLEQFYFDQDIKRTVTATDEEGDTYNKQKGTIKKPAALSQLESTIKKVYEIDGKLLKTYGENRARYDYLRKAMKTVEKIAAELGYKVSDLPLKAQKIAWEVCEKRNKEKQLEEQQAKQLAA